MATITLLLGVRPYKFVVSCIARKNKYIYLYNKVGYKVGSSLNPLSQYFFLAFLSWSP